MQSVHDGTEFRHEPLRLSVVINAPKEAITEVLKKHASVRALCDNGWIFLMALDDAGKLRYRYRGNLAWESVGGTRKKRREDMEDVGVQLETDGRAKAEKFVKQ